MKKKEKALSLFFKLQRRKYNQTQNIKNLRT